MPNRFGFQSNTTIHAAFWIWKPDPLLDPIDKERMVNLNDLQYIETNQPAVLMPGIAGIAISDGVLTVTGNSSFKSGMNAALSGLGNATFLNGLIVHVRTVTPTKFTAHMPPISAEISRIQILGNVLTVTANNNFTVGMSVTFSGLVNAAFLNGQTVTITGVSVNFSSPSGFASFTADFNHTDYGVAGCGDGNDNGVAVLNTDGYSAGDSGSASDTASRTVWLYYAETAVSTSERAYILKGTSAQAFINDMEALWTGMGASQSGAGASGFVSNGQAGQLAYYATTGTMVSGTPEAFYSNGTITLGGPVSGQLILKGLVSGGVTISEQANAGNWTFTLPTNPGLAGQVLQTDGTGITVWASPPPTGVVSVSGAGIATGTVTSTGSITVLGSGNTLVAATALANLSTAPAGNIISSDGFGNVRDSNVSLASVASLTSPAFVGIPTAPTAVPLTDNTQVATTAYVDSAVEVETSRAEAAESLLQPLSEKGQPNGYASLNANGQVPTSQLPAVVVNQTYVVADQAAMLALPDTVGEIAVRTDLTETFILQSTPASVLGNWVQLLFPPATVLSVNGFTGVVSLAFSDLSSHPTTLFGYGITDALPNSTVLPATFVAVTHEWLNSYSSTTGLFTATQPASTDLSDYTTLAYLASPNFTGTVTIPIAAITTLSSNPNFTGAPTSTTPLTADNSGRIATTAYVQAQGYLTAATSLVASVFGRTGAIIAVSGDYTVAQVTGAAPLVSPAFTGTPTAPTAAPLTANTQVATTAYADSAVSVERGRALAAEGLLAPLASPTFTGTVSFANNIAVSGTATFAAGSLSVTAFATSGTWAFAGVLSGSYTMSGTETISGTLASSGGTMSGLWAGTPTFTGNAAFTGAPTSTTPATLDNSTKIATTAFVQAQGYVTAASSPVTSVFGRTGVVIAVSGDYTVAQVTGAAPLASPTFTGTPVAPTATIGTSTTQIATTAFVQSAVSASSPIIFTWDSGFVSTNATSPNWITPSNGIYEIIMFCITTTANAVNAAPLVVMNGSGLRYPTGITSLQTAPVNTTVAGSTGTGNGPTNAPNLVALNGGKTVTFALSSANWQTPPPVVRAIVVVRSVLYFT
jgi:hypothetical protein